MAGTMRPTSVSESLLSEQHVPKHIWHHSNFVFIYLCNTLFLTGCSDPDNLVRSLVIINSVAPVARWAVDPSLLICYLLKLSPHVQVLRHCISYDCNINPCLPPSTLKIIQLHAYVSILQFTNKHSTIRGSLI